MLEGLEPFVEESRSYINMKRQTIEWRYFLSACIASLPEFANKVCLYLNVVALLTFLGDRDEREEILGQSQTCSMLCPSVACLYGIVMFETRTWPWMESLMVPPLLYCRRKLWRPEGLRYQCWGPVREALALAFFFFLRSGLPLVVCLTVADFVFHISL